MKVLTFNVGYFLGYRSQREWLRRPHRLLIGSKKAENVGMDSLIGLIDDEQPDIIALQEIDQGSPRSRFTDQARQISRRIRALHMEYQYRVDTKYGPDKLISRLPALQNMSNMLLWRRGEASAYYLDHGTKQLVHILERNEEPTVISVHLSKTKKTRQKQLQELSTIVNEYESVILTGDFNIKDVVEFQPLTRDMELELHAPGKSFSTAYPTYAFDVFLTSPDLTVTRCELVEEITTSDHLPVIAEIT